MFMLQIGSNNNLVMVLKIYTIVLNEYHSFEIGQVQKHFKKKYLLLICQTSLKASIIFVKDKKAVFKTVSLLYHVSQW